MRLPVANRGIQECQLVLENTGTRALAVMHMTSYTRQVLAGFQVKAENLAEKEGGIWKVAKMSRR